MWLPQLLPQPEAKSRKGRREPELSVTRPVAQLSDKSRVNSSSYRNEALACFDVVRPEMDVTQETQRPFVLTKVRRARH